MSKHPLPISIPFASQTAVASVCAQPSTASTKSPFRYPGGKTRACKIIYEYLPFAPSIVSPFVGGGSVEIGLAAQGVKVTAFDIDPMLTCCWDYLLNDPALLHHEIVKLHPMSKAQFAAVQAALPKMPPSVQKAAAYYAINRASFSGATCSGGMSRGHPRFTATSIQAVAAFKAPNLIVTNADFRTSIPANSTEFMYLDPPYWLPDAKCRLYGVNGGNHQGFDHKALFRLLRNRSQWLMSYNNDRRITRLYRGFPIVQVGWTYGMSVNKRSSEILIGSRDLASHMQRVARRKGDPYFPPGNPRARPLPARRGRRKCSTGSGNAS